MNDLITIYEHFEQFGTNHSMVNDFKLLNTLEDLNSENVNHRCMYVVLDEADISRENASPVYDVSFTVVLADKAPSNDPIGVILSNQENLFVLSQLQDYFILNLKGEQEFGNVALRGFSANDGNITAAVTSARFVVGRNPYNRDIDM